MPDSSRKIENLTALVTTFNEEANLQDCLESISFAGKIMVVDSFSTDHTKKIAARYTEWILEHEYVTPARQKNWALPQVDTEWVLIIDADERVSPELEERIRRELESPRADGYDIKRKSFFFGRLIKYCGWQRDYVMRLFRTAKGRYPDIHVHEAIELDGKVVRLKEPLYHHTYHSFEQYFEKFERYTTWAALDLEARGKRSTRWKMFVKPIGRFLRQYFFQFGFLDGSEGLVLCRLAAMSVFTKYAKLWELQRKKGRSPRD